jgi:hypothetical protein
MFGLLGFMDLGAGRILLVSPITKNFFTAGMMPHYSMQFGFVTSRLFATLFRLHEEDPGRC